MSTVTLVVDDTLTQLQISLELRGLGKLWGVRLLDGAPRQPIVSVSILKLVNNANYTRVYKAREF